MPDVSRVLIWLRSPGRAGALPRGVWALAGVAFGLRLGMALALVDLSAEAYHEFGVIAAHLRAGHGYAYLSPDGYGPVPSAWMPPGYVALLVPFLGLADVALRNGLLLAVQSAAGALCVPLAWHAARTWGPVAGAWGAAGVMAVWPPLVYAASTFGGTVFYHAGVLALLALVGRRPVPGVALGGLLAALVYVRFEAALVAALMLAWLAVRGQPRAAIVAAIVLAAALAPWVGRNAVVLGAPVLSTSGGLNLYRGQHPEGVHVWADDTVGPALRALPPGPGLELARDRLWRRHAVGHVRADPAGAVRRGLAKALALWTLPPLSPAARHPLAIGSWATLVLLALAGARGAPPEIGLLLLQATLVAALFFALARHQVLLMGLLVPLAGHGLAALAAAVRHRLFVRDAQGT